MAPHDSRVTLHMATSLDGFIARRDGSVDWLDTRDEHPAGAALDAETIAAFLAGIDCYVMGSRTYEKALAFADAGEGWAYGDKPVLVLTSRPLRRREHVEPYCGDLAELLERLRARYRSIWVVGGAAVCGECLRRGLADEVRQSLLPILIGDGIPFFDRLAGDVPLHLAAVTAYRNGVVDLRYEVRGRPASKEMPTSMESSTR